MSQTDIGEETEIITDPKLATANAEQTTRQLIVRRKYITFLKTPHPCNTEIKPPVKQDVLFPIVS